MISKELKNELKYFQDVLQLSDDVRQFIIHKNTFYFSHYFKASDYRFQTFEIELE